MRKEKPLLLDEIKQKIDASKAMIVVRYDRLQPNPSWQLRDALSKHGGLLEVVRKRVFLKALAASNVSFDKSLLQGHVGVVFVSQTDAMGSAKALCTFSESNGQILQILCGSMEGKWLPGAEVEMLSKLPGIDEMRATLIGLFTSPMSQTLSVMEAFIEQKS
jgi:large subunit ribosomal protein L10